MKILFGICAFISLLLGLAEWALGGRMSTGPTLMLIGAVFLVGQGTLDKLDQVIAALKAKP